MYIWNLKGLVQALKEDNLSLKLQKKQKAVGLILFILGLSIYPQMFLTETFNVLDWADLSCFLIVTVVGIYLSYITNQRGDGKDFWLRYFSLYLPLTLRLVVVMSLITIIGYMIIPFIAPSLSLDETNWFDLVTSVGVEIYFTALMVKYFKVINRPL